MMFAYVGPETLLPITSIVAAGMGVFLMLGRTSLRVFHSLTRAARRLMRTVGSTE
jgi:hypothetical protein